MNKPMNNEPSSQASKELDGQDAIALPAKILVVDDRNENLIAMRTVLEGLNAEIYTALSGNEALTLSLEFEFAVILLDIQMPEMDGFETATLLRSRTKSKAIPIIFVTAISKERTQVFQGYDAGAVDYLFKPVDSHILKSKVQIFLELYYEKHRDLDRALLDLQITKRELEESNRALHKLAHHDSLTSLPNRLRFESALKQAIAVSARHERLFALLFIDLDDFKVVNDNLGHQMGDALLKQVAERLRTALREEDFIARLGGDEFAVLLQELGHYYDAGKIADIIIKALTQPFQVEGNELRLGASIGIACYPSSGKTGVVLAKNADIAMYRAKSEGGNSHRYFTTDLNRSYTRRSSIETMLRFAVERNEFQLVYQPVVALKTGKVVGLEALLRWEQDKLGNIPPDEFIPIAEEVGLAAMVGEWVLRTGCAQFSRWYEAGFKEMQYALNLSVCQLQQSDLIKTITDILDESVIPAKKIVLEVTETALMQEEERSTRVLEALHRLGFELSIDDFGTGYSSLGRLQKLPINILKIDRTFLADIEAKEDALIAKSILALANSLNLATVGEGVETKKQQKFLIENHCQLAQGYYYSRPVDAQAMEAMMRVGMLPLAKESRVKDK